MTLAFTSERPAPVSHGGLRMSWVSLWVGLYSKQLANSVATADHPIRHWDSPLHHILLRTKLQGSRHLRGWVCNMQVTGDQDIVSSARSHLSMWKVHTGTGTYMQNQEPSFMGRTG